ncbi:MAG: hypothetical protein B7Z55_09150 [Planctomycetales bacterium 12-60-4]|nr:MAG: hypothetical protein B7Z55_09150 [Planctomycetales bacterium 12-60-4]
MTKSSQELFLEIAASDGGRLTEESAAKLEGLLGSLKPGERTEWFPAAHLLLGLHYDGKFWGDGFPVKAALSEAEANVTVEVIDHFTAFLHSSVRPCFRLLVGDEEIELPDQSKEWWAAFGFDMQGLYNGMLSDPRIPLCGENLKEIDLIGVALDRRALAYYLSGNPKNAADSLAAALVSPSVERWWEDRSRVDLTRLLGWIGWLYFDAGNFAKAAAFLQRCFDELPHQPDEGSSPVTAAFVRLVEMYMLGGNDGFEWRHAIAEIGNIDSYGDFLPTGTLDRGCDAFLLRLAISHAATGDFQKAMNAADLCVKFGEPLEDVQFEVYQDFKPTPYPEARLLRAALGVKLSQEDHVLTDLALCQERSDSHQNEVRALACLLLLHRSDASEFEGTPFAGLARQISKASPDERSEIERLCDSALKELLDGSLVKSGFRSTKAEEAASLLDGLLEADRDE